VSGQIIKPGHDCEPDTGDQPMATGMVWQCECGIRWSLYLVDGRVARWSRNEWTAFVPRRLRWWSR
jgi:hypothetical protein